MDVKPGIIAAINDADSRGKDFLGDVKRVEIYETPRLTDAQFEAFIEMQAQAIKWMLGGEPRP